MPNQPNNYHNNPDLIIPPRSGRANRKHCALVQDTPGQEITIKAKTIDRRARRVSLLERVSLNLEEHRLLRSGQRILVAVSGGVDSMVLLYLLHQLAQRTGWKLTVAHLNHQLRGTASDADARLVRRVARQLKLPIVVSRANVRSAAKLGGVSLEMAARKVRHEFLAEVASERGISTIALAHHLDDQIELFFLRLLRGSGSQALSGMKWKSQSPVKRTINLVRPLLACTKQALRQYASEQRIQFRDDATNASLDIQRNRVRHELLPLLRRHYQPGLSNTISRIMDILSAESDLITGTAEAWLAGIRGSGRKRSKVTGLDLQPPAGSFDRLPIAIQRRCLQLELLRLGILPDYDLVEHLRRFPQNPIEVGRARTGVCPGFEAEGVEVSSLTRPLRLVRQGSEILCLKASEEDTFEQGYTQLDLRREGQREWDGVKLAWQTQELAGQKLPAKRPGTELFDAGLVGAKVRVRHWQAGDRFQPSGMDHSVKLQDLFVNQKVPRKTRRRLLVASTSAGELFWVEGLRISERFKLTKGTIRRLHWRWQRL